MSSKSLPVIATEVRPRIAEVLKALGHPVRLHIVELLAAGESTVGDLQDHLGLAQSTVSQQMGVLRHASVVSVRRDGNRRFYSLANPELLDLLRCLSKCRNNCSER